jgi:hypothetical protein
MDPVAVAMTMWQSARGLRRRRRRRRRIKDVIKLPTTAGPLPGTEWFRTHTHIHTHTHTHTHTYHETQP